MARWPILARWPISIALLFLASQRLQLVTPAVPGDEITSLPGWEGPLPTRQYSGYIEIDATTGKYLHYWFVQSANNPDSDPLVLWMNGGPGCSSLNGYFNEQGPLHFNRSEASLNATIPSLVLNPYAWNRIANMIFLEAPAGVGFSYSNTPSDYITDDNKTALDNFNFLVKWFAAYPEYKNNDFYVAGESYAGIYVPTLANMIRIMNEQGVSNINLKGFLVGNGCIGDAVGACGDKSGVKIHVDFYYNHGLVSNNLYNKIVSTCDFDHPHEPLCLILLEEMALAIGRVNIYNIYAPCNVYGATPMLAKNTVKNLIEAHLGTGSYRGPDGCLSDPTETKYFNNAAVRDAIHVAPVEQIGDWEICTSKILYFSSTHSLLPIYPTLIKTYHVLIYNGDVDGCVPYIGDEQWTSSLGFAMNDSWRPWTIDDQVAGYVTVYDTNSFTFLTVKGAGHMVPQFQPRSAYNMFERYLLGQPF